MEPNHALAALETTLGRTIRGKGEVLRAALTCLVAGGHLLLEDVPGTGKTTLARSLAQASGLGFSRIQMTSDLLPQDLTGARYPLGFHGPLSKANGEEPGSREEGLPERLFRFVPGPVFSEVVLADELNRTPPRTQSALLEAMAEGAVTVEGERHPLPQIFFVVATQNPVEFQGTFPLPESQLDRFMMRLAPGYPNRFAERQLVRDRRGRSARSGPGALLLGEDDPSQVPTAEATRRALTQAMDAVDQVTVVDPVEEYLLDVIAATRAADSPFEVGASPRATLDLDRAARARALLDGRDHVIPEDIKALSLPVLAHRLVPKELGYGSAAGSAALLDGILDQLLAPSLAHDGSLEI